MENIFLPNVQSITDITWKRVLLRSELNVPLQNGMVVDDYRLKRALETIKFLQDVKAKTIIIGHIGSDAQESMRPVFEYLQKHIQIYFVEEVVGEKVEIAISEMKGGDTLLLENVRKDKRELTNDPKFAEELASYADYYVNDAFSVSHRKHASIVGVPQHLPSAAGLLFFNEVAGLSPALNPTSPSLCIIGGAKFETKEPLIQKFFNVYDKVFIGGALANDFFKAQGHNIGQSLTSSATESIPSLLQNEKLLLPVDVVVEDRDCVARQKKNTNGNGYHGRKQCIKIKKPEEVTDADYIYDSGPETIHMLQEVISNSKFILWNGPLGEYEHGFSEQSEALAKVISDGEAQSIVGGGDTVATISKLDLEKSISFISTAGGAMLTFLLEGTLPGIEAIQSQKVTP